MKKLEFLKIVMAYLAVIALVCCLHMLIFGKESTMNTFLACVISGSTIGLYILVGAVTCAAIYAIATSGKEKIQVPLDLNEQKITLNDVIISEELKEELKIVCKKASSEEQAEYEKMGIKQPKGYIFYGPPGTGKTLLARAIAGEADMPFFEVSGSSFITKMVGSGAENIRYLFAQARRAPSIIFIDEIDSIGQERTSSGNTSSNMCRQTINQLLTEMSNDSNKDVIVIAATNRMEDLDRALVREGRFDKKIHIPLPNVGLREKILELYTKNVPKSDIKLEEIAEKTEGYTGAKLAYLVNEVKICALNRTKKAEECNITMDDFNDVLEKLKSEIKTPKDKKANVGDLQSTLQSLLTNLAQDADAGTLNL